MGFQFGGTKEMTMAGIVGLVVFCLGLLIGHLMTSSGVADNQDNLSRQALVVDSDSEFKYDVFMSDKWRREEHLIPQIMERIQPENIRNNLRYLSEKPHLAATPRDVELAKYIKEKFDEAGFDSTTLVPYNLFLTKPDPLNPNKIYLHENGVKIFESQHKEKPIHSDDEDPNFVHAFNAFIKAGTVSTEKGIGVVYVNYGRIEDFEQLGELGVNVSGHIVLARYGKIYRGNKVELAEKFGAKGVILYSDPKDVALDGTEAGDVYDKSWWLPGTGIQRGSTYIGGGDPLTPGWPSTEHAYRLSESEASMHNIICQPIGYHDALEILKRLDGVSAPGDWQGGLPNLTYRIGPNFNAANSEVSLTLSTHNKGKIEESFNVIGIIKGETEPDRYVMIGNHRDAWGYGASDPSSGTAQLVEIVRVFGSLLKEGWKPRRSIVFCSWGAEEYGKIGSIEWVEENIDKLMTRAVAYINTDTCASGPILNVGASPLLHEPFLKVAQLIPGVKDSSKTLYDEWKSFSEELKPDAPEKPIVNGLGSGSDYAAFTMFAGVPSADIWFRRNQVKHNISIYPFYHTGYETFYMVSTFVDPDFKIHQGCGRLSFLTLKFLADSMIIPYSIEKLPRIMLNNLKTSNNRDKWIQIYSKYHEFEAAVSRLEKATVEFRSKIKETPKMSSLQVRAINDQMMKLEQIFLMPEGLPGRSRVRNAVSAPSQFDSYASNGFPGLSDLLHNIDSLNQTQRTEREKLLKKHISDLTIMTDRAASLLKEAYFI